MRSQGTGRSGHANRTLTTVAESFEMKPQLKYVVLELASESVFVRVFPFTIDNFKSDVLVWWSGCETQDGEIPLTRFLTRSQFVGWSVSLINQIRIEHVEFIALNYFRWWIIQVIMSLIVFVPHEPRVNTVEETRFSRSIFIRPEEWLIFNGDLPSRVGNKNKWFNQFHIMEGKKINWCWSNTNRTSQSALRLAGRPTEITTVRLLITKEFLLRDMDRWTTRYFNNYKMTCGSKNPSSNYICFESCA